MKPLQGAGRGDIRKKKTNKKGKERVWERGRKRGGKCERTGWGIYKGYPGSKERLCVALSQVDTAASSM